MIPRKKEMFNMIQTREGALCKPRKTHKTKEAEGGSSVGQYCSDTFSFTSLNLDISRFLASVRNSVCESKSKRWSNQERFWLFQS
jgi:hypothetical protein